MVKERKLAVSDPTIFIAQLSAGTRHIIREDLRQHARENGYRLEWDWEAKDYVGMARRFCDIDEIYKDTKLIFCEQGEDVIEFELNKQRNITLKLPDDDVDALRKKLNVVEDGAGNCIVSVRDIGYKFELNNENEQQ